MKKLILILLVCLIPCLGFAEDWRFDLRVHENIYQGKDFEQGKGIEGRLAYKNLYIFGSYDGSRLRLYGQRAGGFSVHGVGLGAKSDVNKNLTIWGQVGHYRPEADLSGNENGKFQEGMVYKLRELRNGWGYGAYPNIFKYEVSGNIGGAVGGDFKQDVFENLQLTINVGYRFLNLRETWKQRTHNGLDWIESKENRSFSGAMVGVGLIFRW